MDLLLDGDQLLSVGAQHAAQARAERLVRPTDTGGATGLADHRVDERVELHDDVAVARDASQHRTERPLQTGGGEGGGGSTWNSNNNDNGRNDSF